MVVVVVAVVDVVVIVIVAVFAPVPVPLPRRRRREKLGVTDISNLDISPTPDNSEWSVSLFHVVACNIVFFSTRHLRGPLAGRMVQNFVTWSEACLVL